MQKESCSVGNRASSNQAHRPQLASITALATHAPGATWGAHKQLPRRLLPGVTAPGEQLDGAAPVSAWGPTPGGIPRAQSSLRSGAAPQSQPWGPSAWPSPSGLLLGSEGSQTPPHSSLSSIPLDITWLHLSCLCNSFPPLFPRQQQN